MSYHAFTDETGREWGSFEVFEAVDAPGFYWWPCFPGCLPDSDAVGPFETEAEALADAKELG